MRRVSRNSAAALGAIVFAAISLGVSAPASAQHNTLELVTTGPSMSRPYPFANAFNTGQMHSADGRHVFFETLERLVPEDQDQGCSFGDPSEPDDCADVYERFDGRTRLASFGGNGPYQAELGSVSADGQKAVFTTSESLLPADTDGRKDVYQWTNGTLELVSQPPAGGALALDSSFAGASRDGSKVFFRTAERLVPEDQNNCDDIYVRSNGAVKLVSTGPADVPFPPDCGVFPPDEPDRPDATFVSQPDGAHYFFYSYRALVPEDRDGTDRDIYEYSKGTTSMVSTGPTSDTCRPVLGGATSADWGRASADGSRVFFTTNDGLVAEDDNCGRFDTYERDASGVRLLDPPAVHDFSRFMGPIAVSADGEHVILYTNVRLSPEDTDDNPDLYDRFHGSYELLSTGPVDRGSRDGIGQTQVSADGLHVYFDTVRQLVPEDTDDHVDTYERFGSVTRLVTTGPATTTQEPTNLRTISRDGTRAFFGSSERLVAEDTDNQPDTYEWQDGHTYLVPIGPPTPGAVFPVSFGASDDGSRVLLTSDARLTPDDTDNLTDLYVASIDRPPDCSHVSASPAELWPPNGKLRDVALSGASDPDGDPVTLTVTGVTQDEAPGGAGDAVRSATQGHVLLRADRAGKGDGRVYRVSFTASDAHSSCAGAAKVSVPHSSVGPAVDSAPPSYDSLAP